MLLYLGIVCEKNKDTDNPLEFLIGVLFDFFSNIGEFFTMLFFKLIICTKVTKEFLRIYLKFLKQYFKKKG